MVPYYGMIALVIAIQVLKVHFSCSHLVLSKYEVHQKVVRRL